jgi:hypothetical protein
LADWRSCSRAASTSSPTESSRKPAIKTEAREGASHMRHVCVRRASHMCDTVIPQFSLLLTFTFLLTLIKMCSLPLLCLLTKIIFCVMTLLFTVFRCGGQGDILSGALAVFLFWAQRNPSCPDPGPGVIAGWAAARLARACAAQAFSRCL